MARCLLIAASLVVAWHNLAAASFAQPAPVRVDKIKFRNEAGHTLFSLKWRDDGAKLVDEKENELARYTRQENKIKIKDERDNVLGWAVITTSGNQIDRLRLESADHKTELYTLKRHDDGDWKLEDPQQFRLYTIKKRDYGVEIKDSNDQATHKVKRKDERTSLRTDTDKVHRYTNEPISAIALACLGFDKIKDLRLQMALVVALDQPPTASEAKPPK